MMMGEVDTGLKPDLIPTIIHLILVNQQVFIVMVMTEVDIGMRPDNFIHLNMAN